MTTLNFGPLSLRRPAIIEHDNVILIPHNVFYLIDTSEELQARLLPPLRRHFSFINKLNDRAGSGSQMNTSAAVLVVDDSQTIRNIVVKNLRNLGFADVDIAEDGNLALERVQQKQYGLLISDWEMPNMGGEQLLKALRQNPKYFKMPIIMITGATSRGTSYLAGANAYLKKPFTDADFEKAVRSALGDRS